MKTGTVMAPSPVYAAKLQIVARPRFLLSTFAFSPHQHTLLPNLYRAEGHLPLGYCLSGHFQLFVKLCRSLPCQILTRPHPRRVLVRPSIYSISNSH